MSASSAPYPPSTIAPTDYYTPSPYPSYVGSQTPLAQTGSDFPTFLFGLSIVVVVLALLLIGWAYLKRKHPTYLQGEECWCGHQVTHHLDDQPDYTIPCSVCTCAHYIPISVFDSEELGDMRAGLKRREYEEDEEIPYPSRNMWNGGHE